MDDLASRPELLEDLYTLGVDARRNVDSASLMHWATGPRLLNYRWLRIVVPIQGASFALTVTAWGISALPGLVPLTVLLVNAAMALVLHRSVSHVLHGSAEPARELVVLAALLGRLRSESYAADRLRQLKSVLDAEHAEPQAAVRRLDWLIQMHDWQHNMLFAPVAAAVLWGIQCAVHIEAWRQRHGRSVEGWLDVVGECEALAAFAMYRFEHPDHPFPELVDQTTPPVYDAEQLAHPLIPREQAIRNDVRLGGNPSAYGCQRLKHVGEDDPSSHGGGQRGTRPCGRTGASQIPPAFTGRDRGNTPCPGLLARWTVSILCGDLASQASG